MMQLNERFSQTPTPEPRHQPQEFVPTELNGPLFGQLTTPQVQAPTREFDDTEKLCLLCLEYTWSAEDNPLRPVIIKEMKKIKDGRDLIEELKKIEKNMNLSNNISSQLELEFSAPEPSLDSCEVPTPSHAPEQTSSVTNEVAAVQEEKVVEIEEEMRSQIKEDDVLQDVKTKEDLDCSSSKDTLNVSPEDEQVAAIEDEPEIQKDMLLVMQAGADAGLSNPLDDLFPFELSVVPLHHLIPSLKLELKCDMLKLDNTYSVSRIARTHDDDSYNPKARIMIKDVFYNVV